MLLNRGPNAFGASPVASGNFTNIATNNAADGVYTLNGEPAALADIVDFSHQYTNFNPATDLDAGGMKPRLDGGGNPANTGLVMKEPLRSLLLDGFTVVVETFMSTTTQLIVDLYDDEFNFNGQAAIQNYGGYFQRADWTTLGTQNDPPLFGMNTEFNDLAVNRIAWTVAADRMALSINGNAARSVSDPDVLTGTLENVQLTYYDNTVEEGYSFRLRSFAFYEPVDDADLPTLTA